MIHLWIRFIHGYSFAIAYGSYGVHHAIKAQSRYLNDTIWPTNTPNTFCDYLLCNANLRVDVATLTKTRCLAATETLVASVIKVAEVYKCLNSLFALTPGWKHTLLAAAVTCGFRLASFYDNGSGRAARCGLPSQGDGRSLRVWYHGRQRS